MNIKKNPCSVITVNYNAFNYTKNLLKNLSEINYKKFDLYIIDNFSNDNSFEKILKYLKINSKNKFVINNSKVLNSFKVNNIILIRLNLNYGYAAAVNIALKLINNKIRKSFFWIINNDIEIEPNTLKTLIDDYESNSIVSPIVYDLNEKDKIQSLGCVLNPYFLTTKNITSISLLNNCKIDYLSGVSLFFDNKVLSKVGFISEKYFMYYEDVDWCKRALSNNVKLKINPNARIFHNSKKHLEIKLKFLSIYNRLRFCLEFFKYRIFLVFLFSLISFSYNLSKYLFLRNNVK